MQMIADKINFLGMVAAASAAILSPAALVAALFVR